MLTTAAWLATMLAPVPAQPLAPIRDIVRFPAAQKGNLTAWLR